MLAKNHSALAAAALALSSFACGGEESELEELGSTSDEITAAQVSGTWDFNIQASQAEYSFTGCTTAQGCYFGKWASVQALFDELCAKTQICINPEDQTETGVITAVGQQWMKLSGPRGAIYGWATPEICFQKCWNPSLPCYREIACYDARSAIFASGFVVAAAGGQAAGGLGNLNLLSLAFDPLLSSAHGYVTVVVAAGLILGPQASGGLLSLRIPVDALKQ